MNTEKESSIAQEDIIVDGLSEDTHEELDQEQDQKLEQDTQSIKKIVSDLVNDLLTTFPELLNGLDVRLKSVLENSPDINESLVSLIEYFNKVFPERFFDILYENEDMFTIPENNLEFLPGIDYRVLWRENITDSTKNTLWKYLQLILFSTVSRVSSGESFGETAKLFETINDNEFRTKLEETMAGVQEMFSNPSKNTDANTSEGETDTPDINPIPNPEEFHKHVSEMMNGKLGSLAKEIAEETAKEWSVNMEDATSVGDVFNNMMKNPTKLMDMVKGVGQKLDEKIKSGDIQESELLSEATDLMKKMQETPGMENLQQMLGKMGLGGKGGKINENAMRAHMERQMKMAQQKEKLRARAAEKRDKTEQSVISPDELARQTLQADNAMSELLKLDDVKTMVFRSGEKAERSSKKQENNKKKNKKNKKNKKK